MNDIREIMQNPALYGAAGRVDVVETHISMVFLTEDRAYKIKKQVDFGFLDYSTFEKREENIKRELRLNQRLAPDIYLGMTYLVENGGDYELGFDGKRIEPVLIMKRLDDSHLLARKIQKMSQKSRERVLATFAEQIAYFHRGAEHSDYISRFGDPDSIKISIEENFEQTRDFVGQTIDRETYDCIREFSFDCLSRRDHFIRRQRDERIRDCHGDLHFKQVYTDGDRVWITDCIEFNERFRYIDTVSDLAFAVMDCMYRASDADALWFLNNYLTINPDPTLPLVLRFYLVYRAYVRGKVSSFIWSDSKDDKVFEEARGYFELARRIASMNPRRVLFLMCGPSRSGKSTVADEIAKSTGAIIYRSDSIRKEMFGLTPTREVPDSIKGMVYSSATSESVYRRLLYAIENTLKAGFPAVADATFLKRHHRKRFIERAKEIGAEVITVFLDIETEEVEKRAAIKRDGDVSDGNIEVYRKQLAAFEPPDPSEGACVVRITKDMSPRDAAEYALYEAGMLDG